MGSGIACQIFIPLLHCEAPISVDLVDRYFSLVLVDRFISFPETAKATSTGKGLHLEERIILCPWTRVTPQNVASVSLHLIGTSVNNFQPAPRGMCWLCTVPVCPTVRRVDGKLGPCLAWNEGMDPDSSPYMTQYGSFHVLFPSF